MLAVVLIVVGVVGCGVCTAMVSLWAAGAVLSLIIAGVGVAIGLDREGARR